MHHLTKKGLFNFIANLKPKAIKITTILITQWNKDLEAQFGEEWYTKPLADFFDVAYMTLGETKAAGKVRWDSFRSSKTCSPCI